MYENFNLDDGRSSARGAAIAFAAISGGAVVALLWFISSVFAGQ